MEFRRVLFRSEETRELAFQIDIRLGRESNTRAMPALGARLHVVALLGYVCVALVFAWPLPTRLGEALPGHPGGDTGVYVWNLWVFRHEIVEHGRFPFSTLEILALDSGAPLTLHNYTSLANILAFPLLPLLGTV